jgi:hypothetical protein
MREVSDDIPMNQGKLLTIGEVEVRTKLKDFVELRADPMRGITGADRIGGSNCISPEAKKLSGSASKSAAANPARTG